MAVTNCIVACVAIICGAWIIVTIIKYGSVY